MILFFKVAYFRLLIPCFCWTICNFLNNNNIKKRFRLLRAWIVCTLNVFNLVSFFFRLWKLLSFCTCISALCPTQICLFNPSYSFFVFLFGHIVLEMYCFIIKRSNSHSQNVLLMVVVCWWWECLNVCHWCGHSPVLYFLVSSAVNGK